MEKTKAYFTTQRITLIAILAAISIVLFLPPLQIPIVLFYKLDFSTMPVLLGTFAMGPLTGVIILFVKSLTGLLFSTSLGVGELADFLIGLSMILPAGLYYKRDKTRKNAMTGMEIGAVAATAAGADGLMIEVHNDPQHALCDGAQSLTPERFAEVAKAIFALRPFAMESTEMSQ